MNATPTNSNVRTLLMVDDDDAFRIAMKQAISESGKYKVRSADSGESALEALQHDQFDVIVLDYRMPGISGLNVLQWMHEQKIDTPVVMMTAAGSESVAVEAMKLGAYDYVRKEQIDIDHIGILIDGVVERHLFRKEKEHREAIEREREKSRGNRNVSQHAGIHRADREQFALDGFFEYPGARSETDALCDRRRTAATFTGVWRP